MARGRPVDPLSETAQRVRLLHHPPELPRQGIGDRDACKAFEARFDSGAVVQFDCARLAQLVGGV